MCCLQNKMVWLIWLSIIVPANLSVVNLRGIEILLAHAFMRAKLVSWLVRKLLFLRSRPDLSFCRRLLHMPDRNAQGSLRPGIRLTSQKAYLSTAPPNTRALSKQHQPTVQENKKRKNLNNRMDLFQQNIWRNRPKFLGLRKLYINTATYEKKNM